MKTQGRVMIGGGGKVCHGNGRNTLIHLERKYGKGDQKEGRKLLDKKKK